MSAAVLFILFLHLTARCGTGVSRCRYASIAAGRKMTSWTEIRMTSATIGETWSEMANTYFSAWRSMCILICRFRGNCTDDTPAGLLFQCFAGDNRSSAAWVAWLVFQHHMTASEGIHLLLQARPSLNPWQGRPHILWALKTWEMRRRKLVTSFRPWLTKGCHD